MKKVVILRLFRCEFSRAFRPIFNATAKAFPGLRFASIDGALYSTLTNYYGITSFPAVIVRLYRFLHSAVSYRSSQAFRGGNQIKDLSNCDAGFDNFVNQVANITGISSFIARMSCAFMTLQKG